MEASFLTAIHIHKIRHLTDIDIPLSTNKRKNLILTGKNGSGKTSVLSTLKDELESMAPITAVERVAFLSKKRQREAGALDAVSGKFSNDFQEKYGRGQFVLAYYSDTRRVDVTTSTSIEKVTLKPPYRLSEAPAKDLVKYMVSLKATQAFAKNENNPQRSQEIEHWFQRFEKILCMIYQDKSVRLVFDIENFQFSIYMDNREPFDFNTMSMGYAAAFHIIADLMMRMESQRRYDLEGIVLIDEIETHLHVELQKQIVPILTELFPNIQFIMTTHSPFVLNSAPNSVIYDLEKHMLVENGLTNLPYEGIVEGYFGSDLLSQELREKYDRYRELVQRPDLTDEDYTEAAELEMYLDEVPDYLALNFAAEYSRLKLEFANRG